MLLLSADVSTVDFYLEVEPRGEYCLKLSTVVVILPTREFTNKHMHTDTLDDVKR